jgi:hypothetical protein
MIVIIKNGHVSVRKPCGTLVSYAWHNWSTFGLEPLDRRDYLREKWGRFIRLLSFISKDFAIIKNDQLVFRKGYEQLTKEYYL